MDGWIDGWMKRWTEWLLNEWLFGYKTGSMDVWFEGMDGRTEGQMVRLLVK